MNETSGLESTIMEWKLKFPVECYDMKQPPYSELKEAIIKHNSCRKFTATIIVFYICIMYTVIAIAKPVIVQYGVGAFRLSSRSCDLQ